jgi:hypothetical protein
MEHILKLDNAGIRTLQEEIFPKIVDRETILFLGAGASVTTDKKFLSREIIELYEAKKNLNLGITDIVKFVDVLSDSSWFDRNEFDREVDEYLRKLSPTETHRTIASIFWKEIITTNFDLLIEQAESEIEKTSRRGARIVPIRSVKRYSGYQAGDELRYVKLHGCMSDRSEYPFVFSSEDFRRVKSFYKVVLSDLKSLSPKIQFLSVGYSFSDPFAERLWEDFDKYSDINKRWIVSVDPFVRDEYLAYLSNRRTRVVRATAEEFFAAYKQWADANDRALADRYQYKYHDRDFNEIRIDNNLRLRLGQNLRELSPSNNEPQVQAEKFYRGDKPTFSVIKQGLDVIKKRTVENVKKALKDILAVDYVTIPIVFLEGSFGTGKTTFTYRLANELRNDEEFNAVCFEVFDPRKLRAVDLAELFEKTNAQSIVLIANDLETPSLFQAINELRYQLSVEQFKGFRLVIVGSIRENILHKYQLSRPLNQVQTISVDAPLTEEEIRELIGKLRQAGLVRYRTESELRRIATRVLRDCNSDLLLAYIDLVADSHHDVIVRAAFSELTAIAQESILKISLLYRFGILMPMTLLRSLINKDWEEFRRDVVDYDSKNIIVQEETKQFGTEPDIYLRVKHRLIAELFVKEQFAGEDRRFQEYQRLLRFVNEGPSSARLVVDLLKALRMSEDLSKPKIDRLFDEVYGKFTEDPHFAVHYAMNLQRRRSKEALLKGVEVLKFAGSFSEMRNDRILHRRAALNFELARVCFDESAEVGGEMRHYMEEAEKYFELKLMLDPCSDFSYTNYLQFLLWKLDRFNLDKSEHHRLRVQIEELIEEAEMNVQDGIEHVLAERDKYIQLVSRLYNADDNKYVQELNAELNDPDLRPYALILLYHYYRRTGQREKRVEVVRRLEREKHLDAVVRTLFRAYGENLYDVNARQKLLSLERGHLEALKKDRLRYHYYRYVAYSYNKEFRYAWEELSALRRLPFSPSSDIEQIWCDSEGEPRLFEAHYAHGKAGAVFLPEIQRTFNLRGPRSPKESFQVSLHFLVSETVAVVYPDR